MTYCRTPRAIARKLVFSETAAKHETRLLFKSGGLTDVRYELMVPGAAAPPDLRWGREDLRLVVTS
jgi:hypothetical protein